MASFRGSKAMSGANGVAPEVDPALYRNLVEMIPLMESFMVCSCAVRDFISFDLYSLAFRGDSVSGLAVGGSREGECGLEMRFSVHWSFLGRELDTVLDSTLHLWIVV